MSAWLLCAGVTAFDLSLRTAIALRCSVFPWENESTVLQYREMVWCWDALGLVSLILTRARLFSTVAPGPHPPAINAPRLLPNIVRGYRVTQATIGIPIIK